MMGRWPFTRTVPIFAAKFAKMGPSPWLGRGQARFPARTGPKSETVPGPVNGSMGRTAKREDSG